jgi:RNA polymerase sigma-70 factor, ECF subfamily
MMPEPITRALEDARRTWPDVRVDAQAFARYVRERIPAEEDLPARHLHDLVLAFACAHGDAAALARFEREGMREVPAYLGPHPWARGRADDVAQMLRVRLLAPREGALPGIAGYTGRGPLGAWLRIATIRAARDLARRDRAHDEHAKMEMPAPVATPEHAYVRRRTSREFRAVLEAVLVDLPPRDRALLKMHFLEGMSTDRIAALYAVDGSTVRRWISQIRASVERATKRALAERLRLGARELESVMGALESELEISISRCLGP